MRLSLQILLLMVLLPYLVCAAVSTDAQTPARPPLTVSEYIEELDRVIAATSQLVHFDDATALINSIPTSWQVHTQQAVYEVSSEWLRADLGEWQKKQESGIQEKIIFRLTSMRAEAASLQTPESDVSTQRSTLNGILNSAEFQNVQQQSWLDRLKQKIQNWLYQELLSIFSSSAIPTIGNALVYGLIGIAVLVLAHWMYRTILENARVESILPGTLPVSSKEWSIWLAEAHAAANAGSWRDAIHLAYWCGISFLEAQGTWSPDRARTPREYLRLMSPASERHTFLRALTRNFELVWYGTQEADAAAFSDTVQQLEKLGCQYR